MTSKGMKGFKEQLNRLKEKGANIDPDEIVQDLIAPAGTKKTEEYVESFDNKAFGIMRRQIEKLLDDFENFYGPKGRGLSVAIHVSKENSADKYADTFNYIDGQLSIVHIVDIGTKGKYEPITIDETMILEQKEKVEEKEKRLGRKK